MTSTHEAFVRFVLDIFQGFEKWTSILPDTSFPYLSFHPLSRHFVPKASTMLIQHNHKNGIESCSLRTVFLALKGFSHSSSIQMDK